MSLLHQYLRLRSDLVDKLDHHRLGYHSWLLVTDASVDCDLFVLREL